MTDDWPSRLPHFSLVVDVIEDTTFEDIKSALGRYSTRQLVIAYLTGDQMWVVDRDGAALTGTSKAPDTAVDRWSGTEPLPAYRPSGQQESRTSIVLPLEYGERRFGVLNLEFEDHLPISAKAKRNVTVLADALGRIIWIWKTTETQLRGSKVDAAGGPASFDNPNVLFEAGMLQMLHELRDRRDAVESWWIPIREGLELSPPLPFRSTSPATGSSTCRESTVRSRSTKLALKNSTKLDSQSSTKLDSKRCSALRSKRSQSSSTSISQRDRSV